MDPERWKKIDELVDAALDLPEAEREGFVAEKSGDDLELRQKALELIGAEKASENFLQNSAMNQMARTIAEKDPALFQNSLYNRTIGNYKIKKILGFGGMGEVYLAQDQKLNRQVALKILPKEFHADDERVKRFEIEARAIAVLNHPNIVTVYDFGHIEGVNYIATEFVKGKTVRDLIGAPPALKEILSIILQAADALTAAHEAGIIHRDIKPENIMVRPDGYVKILDFGLAKLTENEGGGAGDFAATLKGAVLGTPAYMSPEQASGDQVDNRTDLWSIGLVFYEMLTGNNPFKRDGRQATIHAVLTEAPLPASNFNPEVTPELDRILTKALEKDADLSYQTASDLRADLKRVKREIDSSPSWSRISGDFQPPPARPKARNHLLFLGALFSFFLLLGSIWFFYYRSGSGGEKPPDWTRAQNVRLSDRAGTEFYPSLAPDGKNYVFASGPDGNLDIFSQRVGGKNPINLTPDSPADDSQPAFSPDGEQIAFRSDRKPDGIYVMGASGENSRLVADFGFHPSWSPDGKWIAVSSNTQDIPAVRTPSSLWVVNIETGDKRRLTENFAMQPNWSPDGGRIAYWFTESRGRRDVAIISPEGGDPLVITDTGNTNWNPVWSPDGKYLYFSSDRGGSMAFWRVRIDEETGRPLGEPEVVPTPAKFNRHLSFSGDGKRLIYVQTENQSNLKAVEFDPIGEKPVGDPVSITDGNREVGFPELSPDGRMFVMNQISQTQEDIVLLDREGGNQRDLTSDKAFDRYPRWSPDGKKIVFASDRSGKYELWTINSDGSGLKQITFMKDLAASIPAFSPDGRRISFDNARESFILDLSKEWNESDLRKFPSPGGGSYFRAWDWSDDGQKVIGYFEGGRVRGMAVYSLAEDRYEKINEIKYFPFWLPDRRRIIYARGGQVFIADTDTKKERRIEALSDEPVRHVRLSRDGRLLYYTVFNSESDIWMLDLREN